MTQTTNEMVLGIELNEDYCQVTYFRQPMTEPETLAKGQQENMEIPMGLRLDKDGVWHFYDEESENAEEDDQCRFYDIYNKIEEAELLSDGGLTFSPEEMLEIYFRLCFESVNADPDKMELYVMVTVRELGDFWSAILVNALERTGIRRRRISVQDYLSSFYYYTVNQKREYWNQDVALIECVDETVYGYVLHIDRSTRPAVAKVTEIARQSMDDSVRDGRGPKEWNKEKDRLFFELLKKVFERRNIHVSYLIGDYFSKTWATRSIQYLCHKRHAFGGSNLYSKGACFAAMERAGQIPAKEILFSGTNMIEQNIGMTMMIRGKESYYPLVNAGINWYEAHHVCEFVLNDERQIRVTSSHMAEDEVIEHRLRLTGLPKRPPRATRVRMTLFFISAHCCRIEVEDLGFGGLFRSSGLTWSREIRL